MPTLPEFNARVAERAKITFGVMRNLTRELQRGNKLPKAKKGGGTGAVQVTPDMAVTILLGLAALKPTKAVAAVDLFGGLVFEDKDGSKLSLRQHLLDWLEQGRCGFRDRFPLQLIFKWRESWPVVQSIYRKCDDLKGPHRSMDFGPETCPDNLGAPAFADARVFTAIAIDAFAWALLEPEDRPAEGYILIDAEPVG